MTMPFANSSTGTVQSPGSLSTRPWSPDIASASSRRIMRPRRSISAWKGKRLLAAFDDRGLRGKRDYAMVAILLGCGLRRAEATLLTVESLQQREEHWVIADLLGKGGHVRTVPVPT